MATLLTVKDEKLYPDTLRAPASLCAFLFFVVILVPQVTLVHRPWLISATFSMWFLCALGPKLTDTIKRVGPLVILLVIMLCITLYKMRDSGGTMRTHLSFVAGPIYLSLTTFLCSYYLLHEKKVLQRIRMLSIIVLAASTSYGIFISYNSPHLVRVLATDRNFALGIGFDPDALLLRGLPGYAIVYTMAMVGLILVSWAKEAKSISRTFFVLYVTAITLLMFHVFLSTLTLAVIVGGVLFAGGLILSVWWSPIRYRGAVICSIVLVTIALSQLEHNHYVLAKTARLTTGMTTQGIREGDETGRGNLMFRSIDTFFKNPLLGCDFSDKTLDEDIGDHSSLIDPLGMYGLLGCIPLLLYHFVIVRNGLRTWYLNRKTLRGIGELGAWVFYGACSFWNPTTYAMLPMALLFLQLTPPTQKNSSEDDNHIDDAVQNGGDGENG